jgi:hypothetical protein
MKGICLLVMFGCCCVLIGIGVGTGLMQLLAAGVLGLIAINLAMP